ncbi:hypothetical protein E5673_01335 [Sphingomonas sp. PAMC26645]|uniref:hypothetical protein n=1 Tax=Sphingomonas sp. PAMC26645 TaxID=2565555 RepID=UPI00109DA48A|nr:hypothetical protein [Sphingomonas sp. PAMC26645]QCB41035.1 hypothetical protein E5673_01335 [Sphingomonas sp. PAMC26645]
MKIIVATAAAVLSLISGTAFAQGKPVNNDQSITVLEAIAYGSLHNAATPVDDAHGLPVRCISGCSGGSGGGGSGDASALNQTTQITAEQAIRDRIGALTSPVSGSTNWLLTDIRTALVGTLTVGTHSVTQSGTWNVVVSNLPATQPISAAMLPLPAGAATSARQDNILSALGSPFQAGGVVGNSAFGAKLQDGAGAAFGTVANPVVVDSLYRGPAVDRGAIVGTSATILIAANANRRGFSIQPQSGASCYINGTTAATADYHSLLIAGGQLYETPDNYSGTGAISIICTSSSTPVYARER